MRTYPSDIYEKLEFDKIIERLSKFCLGQPAKELAFKIRSFDKLFKIERLLDEILEYQLCIDMQMEFPIHRYDSVIDELRLLRTENYVLEIEAYLRIYVHILNINEIRLFFGDKERQDKFPLLFEICSQVEFDAELLERFDKIFTEDSKIKPSASAELKKIFSGIASKERELERVFKDIASKYKKSGYLTENIESFKNSRRVLSVSAENKRKVKGVLHDESSTGKTVFIEPEEVMELNNDLFELEARKRHEVYKILKDLSNYLRPYLDDFLLWQRILVRYDLIRAKAEFAKAYGGKKPKLTESLQLDIKEAYHPLLLLLHNEQNKKTVPFDLSLDVEKRMLVISGPNAGGKSVTLKTVGLNQLMLQSGMLIPVRDDSVFCVFTQIMIDIGDQQSLEGDLSTYSSRLLHMKYFIEKAGKKSIVLMDEFGSGSDPKMGGAIAEAVLHRLVQKKCFGLITTHYSNIKNYAYKSKQILNGAMLFDREELKPTYRLKVGQPGSSFAFEIANKIGLSKETLSYARHKAGKDSKTVDKLLIDLQHEKKALDDELLKTFDEQLRLKKLIKNYESMKSDLDIRRKRLKLEAKEKSYLNFTESEKEVQRLIKDLKKEKDLEKAKKAVKKIKTKKDNSRKEIAGLTEDVFQKEIEDVKEIEIGQFVKLRSGGEPGKIIAFNDRKVTLEMGIMQFEVPRSEIFMSTNPIEQKSKSVRLNTMADQMTAETSIDIRGYSKMEALDSIQEFLDNALMTNASQLKITHGKGTGVLKQTLWQKSKEYQDIKKIWHPEEEFGGQGVTFISFI